MNTSSNFPLRTEITHKLSEPEYRKAFVESRIRRGLPFQIRAMREAHDWNQQMLGDKAGIPQANISRIENTRDTFLSFPTLLKIAEAFDVALIVKFAPFSELEEWATRPVTDTVPIDFSTEWLARDKAAREMEQAAAPPTKDNVTRLEAYAAEKPWTDEAQKFGIGTQPPKVAGMGL